MNTLICVHPIDNVRATLPQKTLGNLSGAVAIELPPRHRFQQTGCHMPYLPLLLRSTDQFAHRSLPNPRPRTEDPKDGNTTGSHRRVQTPTLQPSEWKWFSGVSGET